MSGRILIVGGGDLARRLALLLVRRSRVRELVIACRDGARGAALARLVGACGRARVRSVLVDALDTRGVEQLLRGEKPDVIVQCVSLLSPWYLPGQRSPLAKALLAAGFACQLPAQLPALLSVMRAVRESGCSAPTVNCSYPDVTHAMLAPLDLAPTIGVGNVGMIAALARHALGTDRSPYRAAPAVRVLAHHGHVRASVRACAELLGNVPGPRVFLGRAGARADALAFSGPPIDLTYHLNDLTAGHACAVVGALLPAAPALRTSAPGPLGLPGGYPVQLSPKAVLLDLPAGLQLDEAQRFQAGAAALDGIAEIDDTGRVTFTKHACRKLATLAPELTEPLAAQEAQQRFCRLAARLGLP